MYKKDIPKTTPLILFYWYLASFFLISISIENNHFFVSPVKFQKCWIQEYSIKPSKYTRSHIPQSTSPEEHTSASKGHKIAVHFGWHTPLYDGTDPKWTHYMLIVNKKLNHPYPQLISKIIKDSQKYISTAHSTLQLKSGV